MPRPPPLLSSSPPSPSSQPSSSSSLLVCSAALHTPAGLRRRTIREEPRPRNGTLNSTISFFLLASLNLVLAYVYIYIYIYLKPWYSRSHHALRISQLSILFERVLVSFRCNGKKLRVETTPRRILYSFKNRTPEGIPVNGELGVKRKREKGRKRGGGRKMLHTSNRRPRNYSVGCPVLLATRGNHYRRIYDSLNGRSGERLLPLSSLDPVSVFILSASRDTTV